MHTRNAGQLAANERKNLDRGQVWNEQTKLAQASRIRVLLANIRSGTRTPFNGSFSLQVSQGASDGCSRNAELLDQLILARQPARHAIFSGRNLAQKLARNFTVFALDIHKPNFCPV